MASIHPELPGEGAIATITVNGEPMVVVQEVNDDQHAVREDRDAANNSAPSASAATKAETIKLDPTDDEGQAVGDTPSTTDPCSYNRARTPSCYSNRRCKVQRAEFRAMALLHLNEL